MRLCCKGIFLLMCLCSSKELSDFSFYLAQLVSAVWCVSYTFLMAGVIAGGIVMRTVNSLAPWNPWKFLLARVKKKHGVRTYLVTSRKSNNCENR